MVKIIFLRVSSLISAHLKPLKPPLIFALLTGTALVFAITAYENTKPPTLAKVQGSGKQINVIDKPEFVPPMPLGKFRKAINPVPNQYIVVLKDTYPESEIDSMARECERSFNGKLGHIYNCGAEFNCAINGFSMELTETAALALSQDPRVDHVTTDAWLEPVSGVMQNLNTQDLAPWGLDRIDERARPTDGKYKYRYDGRFTNVYIIDTGIRRSHQEFGGRALRGTDIPNDGLQDAYVGGHGTAVASIVGGVTHGVAKEAKLYSVRILAVNQPQAALRDAIAGVQWVTRNAQKFAVAVMALTAIDPNGAFTDLDNEVRNSIASGITYTVSAGNSSLDAQFFSPARVTQAICVGGIQEPSSLFGLDERAPFSNYGPYLNFFAPGLRILAAGSIQDNHYINDGGTSLSVGYAAGVAAMLLSRYPIVQIVPPAVIATSLTRNATQNRIASATIGLNSPNKIIYSRFSMPVSVSSASYITKVAPNSLVSLYSDDLNSPTLIKVDDVNGTILSSAPSQINFLVPGSVGNGTKVVDVYSNNDVLGSGAIEVNRIAPGLFSANSDGQGVASAVIIRVRDGVQTTESVSRFDSAQNKFVPIPIDFGPETDQLFLILYGTGIRGRNSLSTVTATIGGLPQQVDFAGAQGALLGLDQINVRLLRNLIGRSQVNIVLRVEDQTANTVTVSFL